MLLASPQFDLFTMFGTVGEEKIGFLCFGTRLIQEKRNSEIKLLATLQGFAIGQTATPTTGNKLLASPSPREPKT